MLRIRKAPNTVVGVGIGVGAVRVGECRFGNVPVPARGRAWLLGGGVAQGFTEQTVPIIGRTDSCRPAVNVIFERHIAGVVGPVSDNPSGNTPQFNIDVVYRAEGLSVQFSDDGRKAAAGVIGVRGEEGVLLCILPRGHVRFPGCYLTKKSPEQFTRETMINLNTCLFRVYYWKDLIDNPISSCVRSRNHSPIQYSGG